MLATGFDLNANLASILTLISALVAATVTVIAALKSNRKQNTTNDKLDVINKQTNGTLSALREEVAVLRAENFRLDKVNQRLTGDRRRGNGLAKHIKRK